MTAYRMRAVWALTALTALTALAGCGSPSSRPITDGEAERLATVRLGNYLDRESAVTVQLVEAGQKLTLSGWVDWRHRLFYAKLGGSAHGLLQSTPGVVATRPGKEDRAPLPPPAEDWHVRAAPTTGGGRPLDTVLALLFQLSADRPENTQLLRQGGASWLGSDRADGVDVDVFRGPRPGGPGAAGAPAGEGLRYWVDADGRVRRMTAQVAGTPVTIDFHRADRPDLTAVPVLGGRPITPRPVTDAEAGLLAGIRQHSRGLGSATVRLSMPADDAAILSATGWVDWRDPLVYLAVATPGAALLQAATSGVAVLDGAHDPLSPPPDGWRYGDWAQRADPKSGPTELDTLLRRLLALAADHPDDPATMKAGAAWLRADQATDGAAVSVFEIPEPDEASAAQGTARFRYWVTGTGVLRRLELRTRSGALAIADLAPGQIPALPRAIRA